MNNKKNNKSQQLPIPKELIIIPIKDTVVFPFMVAPLFFTQSKIIDTINEVMMGNHIVGIVLQKKNDAKTASSEDINRVGTAARIKQMVNLQEKTMVMDTLVQSVNTLFKLSLTLGRPLPDDVMDMIEKIDNPARLADLIAVYLSLTTEEAQEILETLDPLERLKKAFVHLSNEVKKLQVKTKIQNGVAKEMGKGQREYLLRQQMKAIQKELGEEDPQVAEINNLRDQMEKADMPDGVLEIVRSELERLEKMNPASAEYTVAKTYVDYLITMPWKKTTEDNTDINRAEEILNEDHYGLEKIKERILEYLAVK